MTATLAPRIANKITVSATGCWTWTGALDDDGYGQITIAKKNRRAHRTVYELLVGPIPDGLELDHLCRDRACVRPTHLEPVTGRENKLRSPITLASINLAKTHCLHGHPFDEANTRLVRRGKSVERHCRKCGSDRVRRHRQRKVAGGSDLARYELEKALGVPGLFALHVPAEEAS